MDDSEDSSSEYSSDFTESGDDILKMVSRSKSCKSEPSEAKLNTPYNFSGFNYNFNPEVDQNLLNNMRQFSDKYFNKSP